MVCCFLLHGPIASWSAHRICIANTNLIVLKSRITKAGAVLRRSHISRNPCDFRIGSYSTIFLKTKKTKLRTTSSFFGNCSRMLIEKRAPTVDRIARVLKGFFVSVERWYNFLPNQLCFHTVWTWKWLYIMMFFVVKKNQKCFFQHWETVGTTERSDTHSTMTIGL